MDGNHGDQTWADPVQVPVGSVMRAHAKRFKEGPSGLIQEVWAENGSNAFVLEDEYKFVNLVQVSQLMSESSTPHASQHAARARQHANMPLMLARAPAQHRITCF